MDNMAEFARRLKTKREELGFTQAQLAEKIGVSAQTISAYEKNSSGEKGKTPTLDKVVSLAQTLGVSIDYLCGLDLPEKDCSMQSLRDIAESLSNISMYINCYEGVRIQEYTQEEYEAENCGVPDEYAKNSRLMALFTLDNEILGNYFGTKDKILGLFNDGAIDSELYKAIIEGQLSKLENYKISKKHIRS